MVEARGGGGGGGGMQESHMHSAREPFAERDPSLTGTRLYSTQTRRRARTLPLIGIQCTTPLAVTPPFPRQTSHLEGITSYRISDCWCHLRDK
jgi:hypothetical protein